MKEMRLLFNYKKSLMLLIEFIVRLKKFWIIKLQNLFIWNNYYRIIIFKFHQSFNQKMKNNKKDKIKVIRKFKTNNRIIKSFNMMTDKKLIMLQIVI